MILKQQKSHFAFMSVTLADVILPYSNSAANQQAASQVTENADFRFISRTFHNDSLLFLYRAPLPLHRDQEPLVQLC